VKFEFCRIWFNFKSDQNRVTVLSDYCDSVHNSTAVMIELGAAVEKLLDRLGFRGVHRGVMNRFRLVTK
jgi:hypothetical protein